MLAFRDKDALLRTIAGALTTGGRFAFTFEEGAPLTEDERRRMPDADTVWLTPLDEMLAMLRAAGLVVMWQEDHSRSHRAMAQALIDHGALGELITAHRLWVEWLDSGRVRKFALVARRPG
jgi:hypothetical protein